jgi:hypothetical protein
MKKLHFFLYALLVTAPSTTYSRLIEIVAEDGTTLHVSDSETVQGFLDKCRQDRHCKSPYKKLALDFNDKLIKDGSPEAKRTLYYHSSYYSNKAAVATLQYAQPRMSSAVTYQRLENTLIDVEAPNGRIKQCSLNESPAYFFRQCRNSGDCKDNAPMTLKFGNFEIIEGSQASYDSFASFNTDSGFAQVKRR